MSTSENREIDREHEGLGSARGAPFEANAAASSALEVIILWGEESVLHVAHLAPARSVYVGEASLNDAVAIDYVIGRASLGTSRLPIVLCEAGEPSVVFAHGATGEIRRAGVAIDLEELAAQGLLAPVPELPGARQYRLPPDADACVRHGEFVFLIGQSRELRWSGVRQGEPALRREGWTLGSLLLHALVLVAFNLMPPHSSALSIDRLQTDSRLTPFALDALETPDLPPWLAAKTEDDAGSSGRPHAGDSGQAGDPKEKPAPRRRAVRGQAKDSTNCFGQLPSTRPATGGIADVLRQAQISSGSIFSAANAQGADDYDAAGLLLASQLGPSWGRGGVGMIGTGVGGGGDATGAVGLGGLGTRGVGGGQGDGPGYGHGAGGMRSRDSRVPRIRMEQADVHGSLSKEVIRRVISRHVSEVRYCYESALSSRPDLQGRVTVKFIISPTGVVSNAVTQQSDLAHAGVESCIAKALQRWTFPAPEGGGLVIVSYPFVLSRIGE